MREAIGGAKIYIIAIALIILFSSYLAFSINRSKTYKVKNEIVSIIERHNGNTEEARAVISDYLNHVGFRSFGPCDDGYVGYDNNGVRTAGNAVYCIRTEHLYFGENMPKTSFQVEVFFQLDIPIISRFFKFKIKGQTKNLYGEHM